jgi:hypothetical protein
MYISNIRLPIYFEDWGAYVLAVRYKWEAIPESKQKS